MIDARRTCPCCHAPRTATKRTDAPLLDILAASDRAMELDLWHREMRATRAARQAERARQSRAARQGWSTRLRKAVARDPLVNTPPTAVPSHPAATAVLANADTGFYSGGV